jgi:PAS domain-containing protein
MHVYYYCYYVCIVIVNSDRNREHAKKSRVRRKFMMDSLQQSVKILHAENAKLKTVLRKHMPSENVSEPKPDETSLLASDGVAGNCSLHNPDYSLIRALQTAQQNFVVSDPSLPDNPIVFASHGFLVLTGYPIGSVLGRNCRFLQGPKTDLRTVAKLGEAVKRGVDFTTVVLNYRADGTSFWNQLFIAALRDGNGCVVNYLGVQCRVSEIYAATFLKIEEEGVIEKQPDFSSSLASSSSSSSSNKGDVVL